MHCMGTTPWLAPSLGSSPDGRPMVLNLWVPRTHPPSSGDHPVLVDEAAQPIGSS
jgi:hypothetical protein